MQLLIDCESRLTTMSTDPLNDPKPRQQRAGKKQSTPDLSKIREVCDALDEKGKEYKQTARQHLRKGLIVLIVGFVLTVFLPGFFVLIDAQVEIWKARISPPPDLTSAEVNISEFLTATEKILNEAGHIQAQAQAQNFGKLVFSLSEAEPHFATPRMSLSRCERPDAERIFRGGDALRLYWTGKIGQPDARVIALFRLTGGESCNTVRLAFPQTEESGPVMDRPQAVALMDEVIMIAGALSDPGQNASDRLQVVSCPIAPAMKNGSAQCLDVAAEGDSNRYEVEDINRTFFDKVPYLFVNFANGFDIVEIFKTAPADGTETPGRGMRRLNIKSNGKGLRDVIRNDRDIFFIPYGSENLFGHANLRTGIKKDLDWIKFSRPAGNRTNFRIRDVVATPDNAFLALWRDINDTIMALSLSDGNGALRLKFNEKAADFDEVVKIHVIDRGTADQLVLLRATSKDGRTSTESTYFAARYKQVRQLLVTPTNTKERPTIDEKTVLDEDVFVEPPPWFGTPGVIPARDAELFARARVVGASLRPLLGAKTTVQVLETGLKDVSNKLTAAEKKAAEQEQTVALWSTIAARIIVISLILYYVQLEMSLYRYDARLSGHYYARARALDYLLASKAPVNDYGLASFYAAIVAIDPKDVSAKDLPGPPIDKIAEILRDIFKARSKP